MAHLLAMAKQRDGEGDGRRSKQKMDELNVGKIVLIVNLSEPKDSNQATNREKYRIGKGMGPSAPTYLEGEGIDGKCEP
jgi:hypothetical protein